MSSGEFSDKPLPAGKKRCPHCGEVLSAKAEACWLCLARCSIQEGTPEPHRRHRSPAVAEDKALMSGIECALLGLLMLGVVIALIEAPGILIVLIVPGALLLIRLIGARSGSESGKQPTIVAMGLSVVSATIVIGLASFIAFFATCFAVCVGGLAIGDLSRGSGGEERIWIASIFSGVVVALIVAVWMISRYSGASARDDNEL